MSEQQELLPEPELEPASEVQIRGCTDDIDGNREERTTCADPIVATVSVVVPTGALPGSQILVHVPASALKASSLEDLAAGSSDRSTVLRSESVYPSRWLLVVSATAALLLALATGRGYMANVWPQLPLHWQDSLTPGWRHCLSPLTIVEKNPDEDWRAEYAMSSQIFAKATPYQKIAVYESEKLGRVLTLDGVLQVRFRQRASRKCIANEMIHHG